MGTIVAAYDGSQISAKALQKAVDMAKEGDRIIVLNVIHEPTEFSSIDPAVTKNKANEMVNAAIDAIPSKGVDVTGMVRVGNIVEEILKVCAETRCSLIVIGSSGRGVEKIGRFRLGSVADGVAKQAPCPVLIVR